MKMCPYAVLASERENFLLNVYYKPLLLCLEPSFNRILNPVASDHLSSLIWFNDSRMTFLSNFVFYVSLEREKLFVHMLIYSFICKTNIYWFSLVQLT